MTQLLEVDIELVGELQPSVLSLLKRFGFRKKCHYVYEFMFIHVCYRESTDTQTDRQMFIVLYNTIVQ